MNAEIQAPYVWDGLLRAFWHLGCYRTEWNGGSEVRIYEPEYRDLYYDNDHHLVIAVVGREQLQSDQTVEFFNSRKIQAVIKGCMGQDVEAIEVGDLIYFRIPIQEEIERVAA